MNKIWFANLLSGLMHPALAHAVVTQCGVSSNYNCLAVPEYELASCAMNVLLTCLVFASLQGHGFQSGCLCCALAMVGIYVANVIVLYTVSAVAARTRYEDLSLNCSMPFLSGTAASKT